VTPERWQQIDSIFREAVKLEGEKRLGYLEKACQGDADLRVQVETLLASDGSTSPVAGSAFDNLDADEINSALEDWRQKPPQPEPRAGEKREPANFISNAIPNVTEGSKPTVGELRGGGEPDPVVGWLVCVKGCNKGRDYRVLSERNRIGRDPSLEVYITGDLRISRSTHAILTYDPRNNQFWLSPGQARGIVYLNGRLLDAATLLNAHDSIELGETGLLFMPLCGERFQWR